MMLEKILLSYLRKFPIDYGKGLLESKVSIPDTNDDFEFTGSIGTKYLLSMQDHVMRKTFTLGMYERNTITQLIRLARPDMTFVNVGANIGAFSLNIAPHVNRVFSFEPNPRTLKYLRANVEMNALKNATVVPMGLSDKDEELDINIKSLGSSSFHKHKNIGDTERVKLTTLVSYTALNDIESVDIMKIDVEGHEMACLKGAVETISRSNKMAIVLELDSNTFLAGYSKKDYIDFMS